MRGSKCGQNKGRSDKKEEKNKGIEDRNEQKKWGSAFEKPKNIAVQDLNF